LEDIFTSSELLINQHLSTAAPSVVRHMAGAAAVFVNLPFSSRWEIMAEFVSSENAGCGSARKCRSVR
jgi:hypothetical protein